MRKWRVFGGEKIADDVTLFCDTKEDPQGMLQELHVPRKPSRRTTDR